MPEHLPDSCPTCMNKAHEAAEAEAARQAAAEDPPLSMGAIVGGALLVLAVLAVVCGASAKIVPFQMARSMRASFGMHCPDAAV